MEISKRRHGCLTAWLTLMVAGNFILAIFYLVSSASSSRSLSSGTEWTLPATIILMLFNMVCAIALFKWKKWGFWGICVSSTIVFVVNLSSGLGIIPTLSGLVGVILLYGVLHIGNEKKGWPQLY